jgi:hypothetical protein
MKKYIQITEGYFDSKKWDECAFVGYNHYNHDKKYLEYNLVSHKDLISKYSGYIFRRPIKVNHKESEPGTEKWE